MAETRGLNNSHRSFGTPVPRVLHQNGKAVSKPIRENHFAPSFAHPPSSQNFLQSFPISSPIKVLKALS